MEKTIGERLRRLRAVAKLSASELGRLSKLSPGAVGHIERGIYKGVPRVSTCERLAETLGVSTEWLIWGVGNEPDDDVVRASVVRAQTRSQRAA